MLGGSITRSRLGASSSVALVGLALAFTGTAHAARLSSKKTCAKFSASAVGAVLGTAVKKPEVRDNLALPVSGNSLGFECGFYPTHFSEAFPTDEPVAFVNVLRTTGSASKLHRLATVYPHYAGYTLTTTKTIGTLAYIGVQPLGEGVSGEPLPQVTISVLKGHQLFYVYSSEVPLATVEKLAKLAAAKL